MLFNQQSEVAITECVILNPYDSRAPLSLSNRTFLLWGIKALCTTLSSYTSIFITILKLLILF